MCPPPYFILYHSLNLWNHFFLHTIKHFSIMSSHPRNCSCPTCIDRRISAALSSSPSSGVPTSPAPVSSSSSGGSFSPGFNLPIAKKPRFSSGRAKIHDRTNMRGWSPHLISKFRALSFRDRQFFAECFERSLMVELIKSDVARLQGQAYSRQQASAKLRSSTRQKVNLLDDHVNALIMQSTFNGP